LHIQKTHKNIEISHVWMDLNAHVKITHAINMKAKIGVNVLLNRSRVNFDLPAHIKVTCAINLVLLGP